MCQAVTIPCSFGLMFYCSSPHFAGVNSAYPVSPDTSINYDSLDKVLAPMDLRADCNSFALNSPPA